MIRRSRVLTPLAVAAVAAAGFAFRPPPVERTGGPLPHQAYVWQRDWSDGVHDALRRASPRLAGLVVLGAEVAWERGGPRVMRVQVDYPSLKSARVPVGVALRVGPCRGPFDADGEPAALLIGLARSLVADAASAGVPLREFQIDFDCAESKLDGYRAWVETIRQQIAPVPLTITALPSWLDAGAFRRLARATDGFVLQVHSLDRPAGAGAPLTLCDPDAARRAVERAARVGVPFRVALPTYGYLAAFDARGEFVALAAEGPPAQCPEGGRIREVRADPAAMAELVRTWTADRPKLLEGIVWYRLPTDADVLNWRWATLASVLDGRAPSAGLRAEARTPRPGLVEIDLVNDGSADAPPAVTVSARWRKARVVAADALNGFERADAGPTELRLRGPADGARARLGPGDRKTIAWVRLSEGEEVETHVASSAR